MTMIVIVPLFDEKKNAIFLLLLNNNHRPEPLVVHLTQINEQQQQKSINKNLNGYLIRILLPRKENDTINKKTI